MAKCVKCGTVYDCKCGPPRQFGNSVLPCPLKEGAIWVHVRDDEGKNLNGVDVSVGNSSKKTEKGISTFGPLDPVKHVVSLKYLPAKIEEEHDLPDSERRIDGVWVSDGEITYVGFELRRKARIKLKVVQLGKTNRVFSGATVELKGAKGGP